MGYSIRAASRARRLFIVLTALVTMLAALAAPAAAAGPSVTTLTQADFTYGTYIIDKPGTYRLGEDISFNPNSPATLTAAVQNGLIPPELAAAMGLFPPVEASRAGFPLFTQFLPGGTSDFAPGGPLTPQYDPAGYGVGFFAAIAISADDVVLDLAGHTIDQSPEHALLQRFFAVIELADQPFVPGQGPSGFGDEIDPAKRVTIKNGTIGLSSHHGIHGNGNEDVVIQNVTFEGYEVGALALNGVKGLTVSNATGTNRKDIPVVGTYSSAQFIKFYVDELVRHGSTTTLTVDGVTHTAADISAALHESINNVHHDIIVSPNIVDGRAVIDAAAHPVEYGLYHNPSGLIDGNSYSFLVNNLGVAVNGFPSRPDGVTSIPSENVTFRNVHVYDQQSEIREIVALDAGAGAPGSHGAAAIDPVGAVFQVWNLHPDTGAPLTISDIDESLARYTGNPVANAQALVAKAKANGEFDESNLDVTRLNLTDTMLDWVEGAAGAETLEAMGATYFCNGDSMFHVNKGAIGFKMDAAKNVSLVNTSVNGLTNSGLAGSTLCGDYLDGVSHPAADLPGYGGAIVRGYTFAGSEDVSVVRATAGDLDSQWGSAVGFDVLTDSTDISITNAQVIGANAGWGGPTTGSPTALQEAFGFYVGAGAGAVSVTRGCATGLVGAYGVYFMYDLPGTTAVTATCKASLAL